MDVSECVHNWVDEMTGHAACSHCGLARRWQTLYEQTIITRDEAYQYIVDYGGRVAHNYKTCPSCNLKVKEGPMCLYHRARIALDSSEVAAAKTAELAFNESLANGRGDR